MITFCCAGDIGEGRPVFAAEREGPTSNGAVQPYVDKATAFAIARRFDELAAAAYSDHRYHLSEGPGQSITVRDVTTDGETLWEGVLEPDANGLYYLALGWLLEYVGDESGT